MTDNINRVWELHNHLEDIDKSYLEELSLGMVWYDWGYNCHYSDVIRIGQSVGEYQVIRHYDVEGCKYAEVVQKDKPEDWPFWVDQYDIIDDEFEEEDENGNMVTCCWAECVETKLLCEYMQEWINCKTGEIVILGKPYKKDRSYLDEDAEWELIGGEDDTFSWFKGFKGVKAVHIDLSVNEELIKLGYKPLDIVPSDDLNYCHGIELDYYDMDGGMGDYIREIITDPRCRKANSLLGLSYTRLLGRYDTVLKIVCRHNYKIEEIHTYLSYLSNLEYLGKDMHSPHYLCPEDFKEMYKAIGKMADNRREREMERRRREEEMKKAYEDAHAEELFAKLRGPYLGIAFGDGQYDVHVLQSRQEYFEEGEAMHHCVGKMAYWKKTSSICVSIRDKKGHREATAEISLKNYNVLQCYTYCDGIHDDNEHILALLKANTWRFKEIDNELTIAV